MSKYNYTQVHLYDDYLSRGFVCLIAGVHVEHVWLLMECYIKIFPLLHSILYFNQILCKRVLSRNIFKYIFSRTLFHLTFNTRSSGGLH